MQLSTREFVLFPYEVQKVQFFQIRKLNNNMEEYWAPGPNVVCGISTMFLKQYSKKVQFKGNKEGGEQRNTQSPNELY